MDTTTAVRVIRYLEGENKLDLARPVARRQVSKPHVRSWFEADLSDLSRLLRIAGAPPEEQIALFDALGTAGWTDRAIDRMGAGKLTGALLSFSNFLTTSVLGKLPTQLLSARVDRELAEASALGKKRGMNAIGLLGAFMEIVPSYQPPSGLIWPSNDQVAKMASDRQPGDSLPTLGTHEIVLWLGFMQMAEVREDVVLFDDRQVNRVRGLLSANTAPSERAEATRRRLLAWLERVAAQAGASRQ